MFTIKIEGTHANEGELEHKDADQFIDELAEFCKSKGHGVDRIHFDHGGLRGGSRIKVFEPEKEGETQTISAADVGTISAATVAGTDAL